MKVTFDRKKFAEAFALASSVAPRRSPKPVLQNVKLTVVNASEGVTSTLEATDLEISLSLSLNGACELPNGKPGCVLLPVEKFGQILRECSDERLSLTDDAGKQGNLFVSGARSQFTMPTVDAADFPMPKYVQAVGHFELTAAALKGLIRRTAFAADTESSRYALGGSLFEFAGGVLHMIATDGRRMAASNAPAKWSGTKEAPDTGTTVVPERALRILERLLPDDATTVDVTVAANDVHFYFANSCDSDGVSATGGTSFCSRLVEGRFPKWRDVLPNWLKNATPIVLPVQAFTSALRQSAIVTSEESRGATLKFSEGELSLAAQSSDAGKADITVPLEYAEADKSVTLDPTYVLDFLKCLLEGSPLELRLLDAESAVVFQSGDDYQYVVMPLARD